MPRSRADVAAAGILALLLAWTVVEGSLDLRLNPLRLGRLDDYAEALRLSRQVWASGEYPADFTYPPIAVLLRVGLGALGEQASGVAWIAAMAAALVVVLAIVESAAPARRPGVRALLGVLTAVYAVQWDFRSVNGNVLFLALALGGVWLAQRGREITGGLLLAASVALKLYPALLVLWLLRARPRAGIAALLAGIALFALPALLVGPAEWLALHAAWLGALQGTARPDFPATYHGYSTSLHTALAALGPRPEAVAGLAAGLRAAVLLGALALAARLPLGVGAAGLLLVLAVVASPMAQPAHGVVWLVPVLLAWGHVLDGGETRERRVAVGAALAVGVLALEIAPSGPAKAVAFVVASIAFGVAGGGWGSRGG